MTRRTMAANHMMELIDYGGKKVPRGYVYQLLLNVAKAQGHDKAESRRLADCWMQGHDLRKSLEVTK